MAFLMCIIDFVRSHDLTPAELSYVVRVARNLGPVPV